MGVACTAMVHTPSALVAQRAPLVPTLSTLDMWIVEHYRGAQLLPDSGRTTRGTGAMTALPYVESVSSGRTVDTVFAVQFSPVLRAPALPVGAKVRFTSPSGVASSSVADVVARRAFRAPRVPNARHNEPDDFRYGWSYLLFIRQRATTPTSAYRGWLVTETASAPAAGSAEGSAQRSAQRSAKRSAARPAGRPN